MKKYAFILFGIFLLSFFLRVMYLPQNVLTFGYDQARDAIISQEILKGDLKIQGPPASTPGLYHGVFYYYLLAPAYFFGHGSPAAVAYWIALLNALTLFVVFALAYLMTKKFWVGILASFLFALSFESIQYATWLSNPTTAVLTIPLMYLGLWAWIKEKKPWAPIVTAIGLGLSIQAEIFLAYHFVPLAVWLWVSRKSLIKKQLLIFVFSFLVATGTMIVNEFKFGFKVFGGIKALALGTDVSLAYAKSVGDYLVLYLNQIGRVFAFNSYPGNIAWGGGFIIGLGIYSLIKKDRVGMFLTSWLFSHITVVAIGGTSTPFLMVGIGPAVSLILAYYLSKFSRPVALLILSVVIFGNVSMILRENPKGATLFAIQKDMLLTKELSLIDYTYEQSKGEPFAVNSLTSPLWTNIVWSYLYKWYGESKYGYVPCFAGHDQVGQIDALPKCKEEIKNRFLILEPMGGIPKEYLPITIGEEDVFSKTQQERSFGELMVQKRAKL